MKVYQSINSERILVLPVVLVVFSGGFSRLASRRDPARSALWDRGFFGRLNRLRIALAKDLDFFISESITNEEVSTSVGPSLDLCMMKGIGIKFKSQIISKFLKIVLD